jgi:hypothetical protein
VLRFQREGEDIIGYPLFENGDDAGKFHLMLRRAACMLAGLPAPAEQADEEVEENAA